MLFHTATFAVFLAIVLALVAITRGDKARKVILLAASYVFYGWAAPVFLVPLLITTTVDFIAGLLLERETKHRRLILTISIVANLGLLAYFKYFNFFLSSLGLTPFLSVLLPVGISFYTFHSMSYTIDVYRRDFRAVRSPLDFALFITFFPVLVAGPILRARQFLPQLEKPIRLAFTRPALMLIVRGFAKKVLIADNLAPLADGVFADPAAWPDLMIWLAAVAFAIQIYCDFSGYSDVARGLGAIFGFDIPLNFERPYFATNPADFWRRWHISLSTWLRDYLYIPLGGNRHHPHRNRMLTMLLGGLWHGASWNFVLWGAMHGAMLIVHRIAHVKMPRVVAWIVFHYFLLLTWIAFRVTDFEAMGIAMRKFVLPDLTQPLFGRGLSHLSFVTSIAIIALFIALHAIRGVDERLARARTAVLVIACVAIGAAFFLFWPGDERPFIYFRF